MTGILALVWMRPFAVCGFCWLKEFFATKYTLKMLPRSSSITASITAAYSSDCILFLEVLLCQYPLLLKITHLLPTVYM